MCVLACLQGFAKSTPTFMAWRWAFFVPASAHVIMGIVVMLFTQVGVANTRTVACRMCWGGAAPSR